MDVIARLPECDGQAADAISAYTQVKKEDAQNFWYVFHDTNDQNHGQTLKIPWYLLDEFCMVIR